MRPISVPPAQLKRPSYLWWAFFTCATMLAVFTWVYYFEPLSRFSPYANDKVLDVLILIPALAAAFWGTKLARQFHPSEPPHRIWLTFAIGWWFWVGGELLGFVYDALYPVDYPEFTFIDLGWTLGYFFLGLSLYYQFRLIYFGKQRRNSALYFLFVAVALALTFALTQWALAAGLGEGASWFAVYLRVFYPVLDTFQGGAALLLFFLFGRGYLGRPWWGLIAFAAADSINVFFWLVGDEWISNQAYLLVDTFSSVAYVSGYMISALAFLAALDHIHRGAPADSTPTSALAGD